MTDEVQDRVPENRLDAGTQPAGASELRAWILSGAAIAALWILLFGVAVQLPVSLVDDLVHLQNTDRLRSNLSHAGIAAAIRGDVTTTIGTANPLSSFVKLAVVAVVGENEHALHAIKVLSLLVLVAAIGVTLLFGVCRRRGVGTIAAAVGMLVSAVMLFLGEVPGWFDLQSLRANWFRLHATDSTMMVYVALHWACLFSSMEAMTQRSRRILVVLSGLAIALAIMMKPTAVAFLVPLSLLAALLAACRDDGWKQALGVLGIAVVLAGTTTAIVASLTAGQESGYSAAYSLNPARLWYQAIWFWCAAWDTLGPMMIGLPALAGFRIILDRRRLGAWRGAASVNAASIYFATAFVAGIAVYVPWGNLLPRYLLTGYVCACALAGAEAAATLALAPQFRAARAVPWALAGVAAAVWLSITALAVVTGAALVAGLVGRRPERAVGFVAGILLLGFGYVCVQGTVSHRALLAGFIAQERAQAEVLGEVVTLARAGQTLGFSGDASDEHIGSMVGLAKRRFGAAIALPEVKTPDDLRPIDMVLTTNKWFGRPLPEGGVDFVIHRSWGSPDRVTVPLSFWEWRQSLWSGTGLSPLRLGQMGSTWEILRRSPAGGAVTATP